jgi:hypothetical protein
MLCATCCAHLRLLDLTIRIVLGEREKCICIYIEVFGGETEGRRPLGSPRSSWENNIEMDLREVGWESLDWLDLAQARERRRALVNAAMNLGVP